VWGAVRFAPTLRTPRFGLVLGCGAAERPAGSHGAGLSGNRWSWASVPTLRSAGVKVLFSVAVPAALGSGRLLQRCLLLEHPVPWRCPGACSCVSIIFLLKQEKDWI